MTKIERLEKELEKLQEYRRAAIKQQNLYWLSVNEMRIKEKEKELAEARKYAPMRLSEALSEQGEDMKNKVYKALLKISLAADFLNECAEDVRDVMRECGLSEHTFKEDVETLRKLSMKVASFACIPNQDALTDMIVDNAEFLVICDEAANNHLKVKLNL